MVTTLEQRIETVERQMGQILELLQWTKDKHEARNGVSGRNTIDGSSGKPGQPLRIPSLADVDDRLAFVESFTYNLGSLVGDEILGSSVVGMRELREKIADGSGAPANVVVRQNLR